MAKTKIILKLMHNAFNTPEDDLFLQPPDSEAWLRVRSKVQETVS